MTGAGSASVAFSKEQSFLGSLVDSDSDGNPEYYLPGRNAVLDELSLQNTLERLREPGNAEAIDSIAGNLEGAISVTHSMSADTHEHVRDIVFNDNGTGFTPGLATSSRWFIGVDYVDGTTTSTVERVLKGVIPLEYSIDYQQETNTVRESLTMGYADEDPYNTSITPGTIVGPTDGNDVPFHGVSLDVDSTTVQKLQSATLSFSNISRFQRGPSRTAVDAVLAAPETTLDAAAIYGGNDYLELAYGGSGSTEPQDQLSNVSGTLTFDSDGTTVATYSLPKLKPDQYDWADLITADTDLTDPITYHVNGGVSIS